MKIRTIITGGLLALTLGIGGCVSGTRTVNGYELRARPGESLEQVEARFNEANSKARDSNEEIRKYDATRNMFQSDGLITHDEGVRLYGMVSSLLDIERKFYELAISVRENLTNDPDKQSFDKDFIKPTEKNIELYSKQRDIFKKMKDGEIESIQRR